MRKLTWLWVLGLMACDGKTAPTPSPDVVADAADGSDAQYDVAPDALDGSDAQYDVAPDAADGSDALYDGDTAALDGSDAQYDADTAALDGSDAQYDVAPDAADGSDAQDAGDTDATGGCAGKPPGDCCCAGDVGGNILCKDGQWTCSVGEFFSGAQCNAMACGGPCSLPCPIGCCSAASPNCVVAGGAAVCVLISPENGMCKLTGDLKPGQCWTDAQCGAGKCVGANVCPCGAACFVADKPGTCTTEK